MKTLASLLVGILFIFPLKAQQGFVVDHNHADLSQIPDQWIEAAKSNLKIRYFRRSHGSHIDVGGMAALRRYSAAYAEKYNYNSTGTSGALFFSTLWNSLDIENATWVATTTSFLDDPANADINVVMWAWSSGFYLFSAQDYVDDMEALIAKYGPGGTENRAVPVTFVFQTACGQESTSRNSIVYAGNMLIRNHCTANNRILFDFNDLECYDPDGNYFGDGNPDGTYTSDRRLNDDLAYLSNNPGGSVYEDCRNWGIDWMNNNPGHELTQLSADNICTTCEHSMGTHEGETKDNSRLHCVLKGQAGWWLWVRLAGWQQQVSTSISTPNQLLETNLNNAEITINLSGDTFLDDNLQISNFQLNSLPSGTSIQSINYVNSQQAQVVFAFDGTDFDTDYDFSITILEAELQGNDDLTSNTLNIEAIDEDAPTLQIGSTSALNENNLDGATIHLELSNETLVDDNLESLNFELINEPVGCIISSITYQSSTTCDVELAFNGTDFDIDIPNFTIEVAATELTGSENLLSNTLTIDAIEEEEPGLQINSDGALTENNLNDATIHLELSSETFLDDNLETQNFELLNEPIGCTIASISYLSQTTCDVVLSFNETDFDTDITNFRIEVAATELSGSGSLQSNALNIDAIDEDGPLAELSSAADLIESALNGNTIYIALSNETFDTDGRTGGEFILQNAPEGLLVSAPSFTSDTTAEMTLSFDGTDFSTDIFDFSVLVTNDWLTGNNDLMTNALTIKADVAQSISDTEMNKDIKLYPNPGSGKFSVEFGFNISTKALMKIINLEGKTVYEKTIYPASDKKIDFDLQLLKPGNYFFVLNLEQNRFVKTFIIE